MSKNEKIKEQIGWLKIIFGISSAILVTLCGWLANNYNDADKIFILLTVSLIVLFAVIIVSVNKKAYKKIDELEEL